MNTIQNEDGTRDDGMQLPAPVNISFEQLKQIVPGLPANAAVFVPYLNVAMLRFGILTNADVAMFIAQVAHESGGFKYIRERGGKAYFDKYDTGPLAAKLGNTPQRDGDGEFYKGRGLIQVTGKENYHTCGVALGIDLVKSPQLLETPQYACLSAAWFWHSRELSEIANKPKNWRGGKKAYDRLQYTTWRICGGMNGYSERLAYYERAITVFI